MSELIGEPEQAPRTSLGHWWLVAMSVVIVALGVACVAGTVWVWSGAGWPVGLRLVATCGLLALGWALVPSPLSVPKGARVQTGQGVQLRQLVAEVAAAVGTQPPDAIVIDMSVNAAVARFGWRQQTVLLIGAPLWAMLPPDARLSVLAHEFGHLVNQDPMRSMVTLPARSFGAAAVAATGGRSPWRRALGGAGDAAWYGAGLAGLVVHGVLALVNTVGATIQLLVDAVAMPDSRRAEFLADLRARQVAGSRAFVTSSERLLISDAIWQDLWDRAPRIEPAELAAAIERSAQHRSTEVRLRRQATVRTNDLWSSHPAENDRLALVEALPELAPSLEVGPERWVAIDAEMSAWYARIHRTLLGTRDRLVIPPAVRENL